MNCKVAVGLASTLYTIQNLQPFISVIKSKSHGRGKRQMHAPGGRIQSCTDMAKTPKTPAKSPSGYATATAAEPSAGGQKLLYRKAACLVYTAQIKLRYDKILSSPLQTALLLVCLNSKLYCSHSEWNKMDKYRL